MRLIAVFVAIAMFVMYVAIRTAIPPQALQQDETRASTADLKHPPTAFGTPAAIEAPTNGRR